MKRFAILCVFDDDCATQAIEASLTSFMHAFDIRYVSKLEQAREIISSAANEQPLAMVVAQHFNGFEGSKLLIELEHNPIHKPARRILVSSEQDFGAIISAVNLGRLDHCETLPLRTDSIRPVIVKELTSFIINQDEDNILNYATVLDQKRILRSHIDAKVQHYQRGFIDYHLVSDQELTEKVIQSLREFFAISDESNACRTYSADHLLTKEGEDNRFLWFITEGEVALYKKDDYGVQREVVRHGKGNIVGGMSFVTGEASFSTGLTLCQTEVIKLDRDIFTQVMNSNTELLPLFTNLLLRHFNRRLQRSIFTKLELQKTIESLELAHQQLIEREKMAVLGQLVAGVAHEINNPIAAIMRGTEVVIQNVQKLVEMDYQPIDKTMSEQLFQHALASHPLSTAELRKRSRELEKSLPDRVVAKKLVNLGLEKDTTLLKLAKNQPEKVKALLKHYETHHQTGSTLRSMDNCSKRIAEMVKSLKGYAKPGEEHFQYANIHEGIDDTLVMFENKLKFHRVEKEYNEVPLLYCQPNALQQVWTNLISNAIDAFPEHGELTVRTAQTRLEGQSWIKVSVQDNGSGIPIELQEKIFTLNFTTKKEGHFGLGIGLSVCQQVVALHQGRIEVESQPGQYTTMTVWLPVLQQNIKESL
ncbi:ATP-binding protein [Vibrio astriarenae]